MSAPRTTAFKVVIPARYGATRLPGKPLRMLAGQAMILHVLARARESGAAAVVVATEDVRIRDVVVAAGGTVCMTSVRHLSGTDRLAEAVTQLGWGDEEIVVNLQGDEPLMPPGLIRQVAEDLHDHQADARVATLCTPITDRAVLFDPNIVKVVLDQVGYALYFSRAPIPWARDAFAASGTGLPPEPVYFRHLGIYAYRAAALKAFAAQDPSPLERLETLEQLRVLWHGGRIHVACAAEAPGPPGVDTEADLQRAQALLETPPQ
ncbi:MAG: 3-deoxy-manno-octulosonate cytidylyltransferase [Chromatiales bacterium 21-64-14]|nr:MAG: 3-deoxy-manno-octulosonate cytidylyltransferase [Chromatiales bacterium 21-64-14]HQU16809.1 3-deoxy-manno-octulosonate cytidylyltransferase [Gammaproteobacteria bacterium]